jgi:hypothetical protein
VTAPIPLAALYEMLPVLNDEGKIDLKRDPLISAEKGAALVRLKPDELPTELTSGLKERERDLHALLAFLSLVVSYIKAGPSDVGGQGLKHVIPIMPRTDFATLYMQCNASLSPYFKTTSSSLTDLVKRVCAGRTIEFDNARLLWKEQALKVTDWIGALPKADRVAEYDKKYRHGQIGGLGSTMEHLVANDAMNVPIFEFRDIGSVETTKLTTFLKDTEQKIRDIHLRAAKF